MQGWECLVNATAVSWRSAMPDRTRALALCDEIIADLHEGDRAHLFDKMCRLRAMIGPPRLPVHYQNNPGDPGSRTGCGAHPRAGHTTHNMDRVTCKRCIAAWNKFVEEGGV